MNYFTEWCDMNQGELETVITDVSNHLYVHEDIHGCVVKTMAYTKQVSSCFTNSVASIISARKKM